MMLLRAWLYCAGIRLALWFVAPRKVLTYVLRRVDAVSAPFGDRVPQIAWAVRAAGRRRPRATCLVEALAAQLLLAKYGYRSVLRIGVRRGEQQEFLAHAWVEVSDRIVVGQRRGPWYQPLPDISPVFLRGLLR